MKNQTFTFPLSQKSTSLVTRANHLLVTVLTLLMVLSSSNIVVSVPAYPWLINFRQPDGSSLRIFLKGDEKVRWAETEDGYSVLFNSQGFYEYATLSASGDMIASGMQAKNIEQRTVVHTSFLSTIPQHLRYSPAQVSMAKQIWKIAQTEQKSVTAFPTTGARKLVCILIGFTDKSFTKTQADFNNLFNQLNFNSTGSVSDYFREASYGQLNLTVDVFGPYTASNTMAYYGANSSGNDIRPRELVAEAVNLADANGANFANYDNDVNGVVDGVYVIYAGYGEEAGASTDCIWAHAWTLSPSLVKDGKTVSNYSCSSELSGTSGTNITNIGVICHEFGHTLGAPDFYDTDYATNGSYDGTGNWDLQAGGSWNGTGGTFALAGNKPAHPNAYTKCYIYNWATPRILSVCESLTLYNSTQYSNSFFRLNTATTNEYFLIENRQQLGFDTYVPGHGLLIYHVDGTYIAANSYTVNASSHQGMFIVPANASTANGVVTSGVAVNTVGCPYRTITSFTDATTPNSKSWAGVNTAKPLTNITENSSTKLITLDFMGGGCPCTQPGTQASLLTSSAVTNNSMTVGWTRGNGNAVIVIAKAGSAVDASPVSGLSYLANAAFGSGAQIGTGNYVVYNGTGTSVNITGLSAGTTYHFAVYEYASANYCYKSLPLTGNITTGGAPCNTYTLISTSATSPVSAGNSSTVTLTASPAIVPDGTYTVTYNLSAPNTATGNTASITFISGSGTFATTALANGGTTTVTITKLKHPLCSEVVISANNTANVVVCPNYALTGTTATSPVIAGSSATVTLTGTAANLPTGTYTVTNNLSTPNAATGLTATMIVTTAGTGTFTTAALSNAGTTTVTITNLSAGTCSNSISSNNATSVSICPVYSTTGTSSISPLSAGSSSTITLTSTASGLPVGTYTVTYNLSAPNASIGLTTTMTVTTAGTGMFSTTALTNPGTTTVTITNLSLGSCGNTISSNNTTNVQICPTISLTGSSAATPVSSGSASTITLTGLATSLPVGAYSVTYNLSAPNAATGLSATMTVATAGTGTFTTTTLANAGTTTVTITGIQMGTCANATISTNNTASVVTNTTYCTGNANSCDEFISRVQCAGIDNTTACTTGGYANYTTITGNMIVGTGYPTTITNGTPYTGDQCGIWIDWNQDGDFADAGETITISGGPGSFTATITPPAGALSGSTRMRVRICYTTGLSACGTSDYGEVEDYTINVSALCSAPIDITTSVSPSISCTAPQSVTFNVAGFTGGNLNGGSWQYQWQNGAAVLQAWSTTASYTTSLPASATYTVYMRSSTCIGNVSSGYGATYTYTSSLPSCATFISPTNGLTGQGVAGATLSWNAVAGASGYDVYLQAGTNPPTTLVSSNQSGTTFTTGTLSAATTYYWYVVPRNACGAASGCNNTTWSFTTGSCSSNISVTATAGTTSGTYTTLKGAFDKINDGTHKGAIVITLGINTTETASAVLNASGSGSASYTSVGIVPCGNITITGNLNGFPLVDLNGADNVTINGINTGSNSLTLQNTYASSSGSTSTIRLYNNATNNTITNCTVLGSSSASSFLNQYGGTIWFWNGTTGNDNNTISNCNIGSAGGNFPMYGVHSYNTTGINDHNVVTNCNIYDFFQTGKDCAGITIQIGNSDWTISNNKIYQTSARVFNSDALTMNGIFISDNSNGNNIVVSGNTIGGNSPSGGILNVSAQTTSSAFYYGINLTAISANVFNNTIYNTTNDERNMYGINGIVTNGNFYGNSIYNLSSNQDVFGLWAEGATINVYSNIVHGITTTGEEIHGIALNTTAAGNTSSAYKNKIYDLVSTGTGSPISVGIMTWSSAIGTINIYNNIIGDLQTSNADVKEYPLVGIYVWSQDVINVYYNTVYLNGTSSGNSFGSTGILFSPYDASTMLTLRNNIIINTSTAVNLGYTVALRLVGTSAALACYGAASGNNLFYTGTPSAKNLIYLRCQNENIVEDSARTLASFKTKVSSPARDVNSITLTSLAGLFVSTNGSDASYLHINSGTPPENKGMAIAGDDFDSQARNNPPEIGADEINSSLPVDLLGFSAWCDNNGISLAWATGSELNNDFFTIERSTDALIWELLAKVPGAGNSNNVRQYDFKDNYYMDNQTVYYRLTQTDYDGSSETLTTVSANCSESVPDINCYPNPFNNELYIGFQNHPTNKTEISLTDVTGRIVLHRELDPGELSFNFILLDMSQVSPGLYTIKFKSGNYSAIKKILKNE